MTGTTGLTGLGRQPGHPLEQRVLTLLAEVADLCDWLEDDDGPGLREDAVAARDGAATVVAVGEQKRGKSRLLNSLLGRPGLLPIDANVATNTYLTVGYADAEWARVFDEASPEGRDIPLDQVDEYAALDRQTGRPQRDGVNRVDIGVTAPLLAEGLVLVDTPGVGGLNAGHRQVTLTALKRADALLFVVSAERELTDSECQFLHDATQKIATVIFVLTKADRNHLWRDILEKNVRLVGQHAPRFGSALWFAVSSVAIDEADQAERDGDLTWSAKLRASSGFPELTDELRTRIAARGREIRLANLVHRTTAPLDRMIARAQQHGQSLGRNSEVGKEIAATRSEIDRLTGTAADWRRTLTRGAARLEADLSRDLARMLDDEEARRTSQISQGGLGILDEVQRDLQAGLEGIFREMSDRLVSGFDGVMRDLWGTFGRTGVTTGRGPSYPDRLRTIRPLDPAAPVARGGVVGFIDRALPGLRNWFTLDHSLHLPGPVSGIIAVLIAWRRRGEERARLARGDAQRYLQQMMKAARTELPAALKETTRDAREQLEDRIAERITARRAELTRDLEQHERIQKQNDDELAAQKAQNEADLTRLRTAKTTAQSLLQALDPGLASSSP
jgi:Dynamin family